jgi:predicted esterase
VPQTAEPWPALFSFHGYGEDATANMAALQRIPNIEGWLLVAVQALHPFYTKNERIVASWMTRQDRELAIADNIRYVTTVVEAVRREFKTAVPSTVFAGFSQGVAMAYRAAANVAAAGVVVLAGDVPPDVTQKLPEILIGRGRSDDWYTEATMTADLSRLRDLAQRVETCVFDGGHEWTDEFATAVGVFMNRLIKP